MKLHWKNILHQCYPLQLQTEILMKLSMVVKLCQIVGTFGDVVCVYGVGVLHSVYGVQEHCSLTPEVSLG